MKTTSRRQSASPLSYPPELAAILRAVAASRQEGAYRVANEWLAVKIPPERIPDKGWHFIPKWFWRGIKNSRGAGHDEPNPTDVVCRFLGSRARMIDHFGTIKIHGVSVFVTEPYNDGQSLPELIETIRKIDVATYGVGLISNRASWNDDTRRFLFFPHPNYLSELMKSAGNAIR
jgi:hypothetical protein